MVSAFRTLTHYASIRSVRLGGSALLALGMFASLGREGLELLRTVQQVAPARAVVAPLAVSGPASSDPAPPLLQLFGDAPAGTVALAEKAAPLPESNLNIQVSAIFFQSTPEQSSVVLEDGDNTLMLKSGEEVRPGIAVSRIESHRITLERGGKFEQISFRGFGGEDGDSPAPSQLPPIVQVIPDASPLLPADGGGQGAPAAYQQYIQRKLAQNK